MYLHSPSQGCDLHTVIGCLYVRTTLTSVVFALCRWPVHTNTHGEYKEERVKVGGEREREGETGGAHTRVSRLGRDRAVSFHPTAALIVTRVPPLLHFLFSLPSFHYFHYSERSRSEISNFGIGSISILDLNSRESVLGRV